MDQKTCSKCGRTKDLNLFLSDKTKKSGRKSMCNDCYKLYKKEYYKENKERIQACIKKWISNNKEKQKAHGLINVAVKRGKITKPNSCSICGEVGRIEAHHWKGYSMDVVYDVQWLCGLCHKNQDKKVVQ